MLESSASDHISFSLSIRQGDLVEFSPVKQMPDSLKVNSLNPFNCMHLTVLSTEEKFTFLFLSSDYEIQKIRQSGWETGQELRRRLTDKANLGRSCESFAKLMKIC